MTNAVTMVSAVERTILRERAAAVAAVAVAAGIPDEQVSILGWDPENGGSKGIDAYVVLHVLGRRSPGGEVEVDPRDARAFATLGRLVGSSEDLWGAPSDPHRYRGWPATNDYGPGGRHEGRLPYYVGLRQLPPLARRLDSCKGPGLRLAGWEHLDYGSFSDPMF